MGLIDLIWWSVAAACWLAGAALVWWAMFHDRARGRRRCPRCWYDLKGLSGKRCPECGREAKSDRQLLRTRRRWKLACAGMFVVALGFVSLATREVQRHGWVDATPTFAYIILLPHLDETTTHAALRRRVGNGELREWEYRMLVRRAIGVLRDLEHEPDVLIRTVHMLSSIEGSDYRKNTMPWGSWTAASEIDLHGCLEALVGLLEHEDDAVRIAGLHSLGQFTYRAEPALPAILGHLAADDSEVRQTAVHAVGTLGHSASHGVHAPWGLFFPDFPGQAHEFDLDLFTEFGRCRMDAACARATAERELSSPQYESRELAVYVLAILSRNDPDVHDLILDLADDPNSSVRSMVISATTLMPLDERVEQLLRGALRSTASSALNAIAKRGIDGAVFMDDVRAIMESDSADRTNAVRCFRSIGGDPDIAIEALLEEIRAEPLTLRLRGFGGVIDVLGEMKVGSPRACEALEPLLDFDDPEVRSAAAVAYTRLGGADLDAATRAVFESLAAADRQRDFLAFSRWFWLATDGRFSHDILRSMLQSENPAERANAVRFLGEAGAAAAPLLPEMRKLLDDADPRVQQWAPNAVRRVEYLSREQQ